MYVLLPWNDSILEYMLSFETMEEIHNSFYSLMFNLTTA